MACLFASAFPSDAHRRGSPPRSLAWNAVVRLCLDAITCFATRTTPAGVVLGFWRAFQRDLESAHKIRELDSNRVANILEFQQVQPPRSGFIFAYEGLWVPESVGYISLV
jgi:hypothetical protein